MKILFLTDNFPPERNAPALRTAAHARRWAARGHEVVVVTGAPNFPGGVVFDGYRNRPFSRERVEGVEVIRVWTYVAPNRGVLRRSADYLSFGISGTIGGLGVRSPDVVVGTSPQLFTGLAAWLVAALKRRPFVFEVRDLWPESVEAVGAIRNASVLRLLRSLAGFLYRQAAMVVPVTSATAGEIESRSVPPERIRVVTNGADPSLATRVREPATVRARYALPGDRFLAAYVGTLGMAHGLDVVLAAAAALRRDPRFHFVLVGEGAEGPGLVRRAEALGLENVTFIPALPHDEALAILGAADAALVLLRDRPLFRTVIPSKVFEAMALGRPVVLGARGEAERIVVDDCAAGVSFPPEDPAGLVARLEELAGDPSLREALGQRGRKAVATTYSRDALADRFLEGLEALVEEGP